MKIFKKSTIKKGVVGLALGEGMATAFVNLKHRIKLSDDFVNDSENPIKYTLDGDKENEKKSAILVLVNRIRIIFLTFQIDLFVIVIYPEPFIGNY